MKLSEQNRNAAYMSILEGLTNRQGEVYGAFTELGNATSFEIAKHLDWPINMITGRITELRDEHGVIMEVGSKEGRFGKQNTIYGIA